MYVCASHVAFDLFIFFFVLKFILSVLTFIAVHVNTVSCVSMLARWHILVSIILAVLAWLAAMLCVFVYLVFSLCFTHKALYLLSRLYLFHPAATQELSA